MCMSAKALFHEKPTIVKQTSKNEQVNTHHEQQQGQDQERARELKFVDAEHQETAETHEFYAKLSAVPVEPLQICGQFLWTTVACLWTMPMCMYIEDLNLFFLFLMYSC